jgi:hypothetical protein
MLLSKLFDRFVEQAPVCVAGAPLQEEPARPQEAKAAPHPLRPSQTYRHLALARRGETPKMTPSKGWSLGLEDRHPITRAPTFNEARGGR